MDCPHCGNTLVTKTIHTVGAGKIDVDYCPSCGGIFFDKGEVNRISQKDAEEIMDSSKGSPSENSLDHPRTHECPRCGASLKRFFGESVPDDVHVLRCPECSGTWFENEELDKFKKAQEAKLNYFRTWRLPLPSLSSVMIPVALFVLLTGAAFIAIRQINQGVYVDTRARNVIATPVVVVGPDRTSATILFTTTEPAKSDLIFTYGGPLGKVTLPISPELSTIHQITIENLSPGQTYQYQIKLILAEYSTTTEEFTFEL